MKRQAIAIYLDMLDVLREQIESELEYTDKLGLNSKPGLRNRVGILFSIVNYPVKEGDKKKYCSDMWQFETVKFDEVDDGKKV